MNRSWPDPDPMPAIGITSPEIFNKTDFGKAACKLVQHTVLLKRDECDRQINVWQLQLQVCTKAYGLGQIPPEILSRKKEKCLLRTESTTDSPEDVKAAFELIGQPVEITTFEDGLNTPNPEETAPAPEQNGEAETVTPEAAAPEPAPIVATPENEEDFEAALLDDSLPKGVRQRIQKLLAKATKTKYEAEAALAAANKAKPEPEVEPTPAPEAPKPAAEAKPKPKFEDFAVHPLSCSFCRACPRIASQIEQLRSNSCVPSKPRAEAF